MPSDTIYRDAQAAPTKNRLERHREAIQVLRQKGYSWREIAQFLAERGVATDHAVLYRFMIRTQPTVTIPPASEYERALTTVPISDAQRKMLEKHFRAPNRTVTYTELAVAAGYDDHEVANSQYGRLGRSLGEVMNFTFAPAERRPGELFYSSALGMENAWPRGKEFEFVMHHELSKALEALGWFK